jgi:hypothetical protein
MKPSGFALRETRGETLSGFASRKGSPRSSLMSPKTRLVGNKTSLLVSTASKQQGHTCGGGGGS